MKLSLFGSGEFTASVDEIDDYLISKYSLKSIAVIPLAAGQEKDASKWLAMAMAHYTKFNLKVNALPVYNKLDAQNKNLLEPISQVDWLFFSGGNPNYLLSSLKDTLLEQLLIDKFEAGKLISGSSAGAMILGQAIPKNLLKDMFSSHQSTWNPALGLINCTVLPHFNQLSSKKKLFKRFINKAPANIKNNWIGIDENTALIIDDSGSLILGQGQIDVAC